MALAGLIVAWAIFGFFLLGTIGRLREFPGWENFLLIAPAEPDYAEVYFASPVPTKELIIIPIFPTVSLTPTKVNGLATLMAILTQKAPTATQPALVYVPTSTPGYPTPVQAMVFQPTQAPQAPFPTQCRQSLPTRFQLQQTGRILWQIALRPDLRMASGTKLAPGTRFRMVGAPICAVAQGNTAEQLWWPVELSNGGLAGTQGWLAESGLNQHGTLAYNLQPDVIAPAQG